jgi:hypothetical protein
MQYLQNEMTKRREKRLELASWKWSYEVVEGMYYFYLFIMFSYRIYSLQWMTCKWRWLQRQTVKGGSWKESDGHSNVRNPVRIQFYFLVDYNTFFAVRCIPQREWVPMQSITKYSNDYFLILCPSWCSVSNCRLLSMTEIQREQILEEQAEEKQHLQNAWQIADLVRQQRSEAANNDETVLRATKCTFFTI